MARNALDELEADVAKALMRATREELLDALADERLPEAAASTLHNGGADLISLGEERARRDIDARFAEVARETLETRRAMLAEIAKRDERITRLEAEVERLIGDGK